MKYDNERISDISLFFLLSAAITEVGVLEMPRLFAESVGRDLWLVPLLMIPVLLLSLYLFCLLGKRFPDETVFEYGPRLLGRPLAQVLFAVLIAYWFLVTGRMMRDFCRRRPLDPAQSDPGRGDHRQHVGLRHLFGAKRTGAHFPGGYDHHLDHRSHRPGVSPCSLTLKPVRS